MTGASSLSSKTSNKKRKLRSSEKAVSTALFEDTRRPNTPPSPSAPFKLALTSKEEERRQQRKQRFADSFNGITSSTSVDPLYKPLTAARTPATGGLVDSKNPSSQGALIGQNQNLEKEYLRLTTFPRAEDVRPLKVLIKSLAHIKSRYCQAEDFEWANEQLKSVRQDMTVQRIRNAFVLNVYETHARILLEHGDLNEFNQCQTMIRSLTEGINDLVADSVSDSMGGDFGSGRCSKEQPLVQLPEAADEFRGYAILYALVRNSHIELKTELTRAKSTPGTCHAKSSCGHALSVVKALDDHDYRTFFRLYESAPHMSAYLMDFLVKRVRDAAYERIIAAYRPNVSVEQFRECLCFVDLEETRRFLRQKKAIYVDEKTGPSFWVDCKASSS